MWGPLWDERDRRLVRQGRFGEAAEVLVEALFARGDWLVLPRPASLEMDRLIGATGPLGAGGVLIRVLALPVATPLGPRWWPLRVQLATAKEVEQWHERYGRGGTRRRREALWARRPGRPRARSTTCCRSRPGGMSATAAGRGRHRPRRRFRQNW
jgi:hypothetical protein